MNRKQQKKARPYKVQGSQGKERKGIVAGSFKELVEKARGKFPSEEQHGETLTLLLAEDRTEVDDEEYFQTLDDNTLFVLVPRREGRLRGRCAVYPKRRSLKNDADLRKSEEEVDNRRGEILQQRTEQKVN